MPNKMIRSIDRFIPQKVLNQTSMPIEDVIRCRVFTFITLAAFLFCSVCALVFFLLQVLAGYNMHVSIIASLAGSIVTFLLYAFFYKTGHIHSAAMFFSTMFVIITLFCIVMSGGPDSPWMPILISCPVIAAMIGGKHEGFYNSLVVMFLGTVLIVLKSSGFEFLQILPTDSFNLLSSLTWIITILLNTSAIYVYQYLQEELG